MRPFPASLHRKVGKFHYLGQCASSHLEDRLRYGVDRQRSRHRRQLGRERPAPRSIHCCLRIDKLLRHDRRGKQCHLLPRQCENPIPPEAARRHHPIQRCCCFEMHLLMSVSTDARLVKLRQLGERPVLAEHRSNVAALHPISRNTHLRPTGCHSPRWRCCLHAHCPTVATILPLVTSVLPLSAFSSPVRPSDGSRHPTRLAISVRPKILLDHPLRFVLPTISRCRSARYIEF